MFDICKVNKIGARSAFLVVGVVLYLGVAKEVMIH